MFVRFLVMARRCLPWSLAGLALLAQAQVPTVAAGGELTPRPAQLTAAATQAPLLGVARAGQRIVAVGDYGSVVLSDDEGQHFRQASQVPVSSTLTAVSFSDAQHGWAVGHWGAILHTADGGETWTVQRLDTQEDRPLFSVHFFNPNEGVAVGLWSLVLRTQDGGKTWRGVELPAPPEGGRADRNLFATFVSPKGSLFVAAERGLVLRSDDHGQTWRYLSTGYKGSFWSGVALSDGTLLVGGLRGTLYRSHDDGRSWQPASSESKSSVTSLLQVGKRVVATALDGVQLSSEDKGEHFTWQQRPDRLSLTAAVALADGRVLHFSKRGVVSETAPR